MNKSTVHGDALHLNEADFSAILRTRDWHTLDTLAPLFPVEIIPGNHDANLEKPIGQTPGNCRIVTAYLDKLFCWHSYCSEFDPLFFLPQYGIRAGADYSTKHLINCFKLKLEIQCI
jgi:hypothetical protein